jgi:hypothetical protein
MRSGSFRLISQRRLTARGHGYQFGIAAGVITNKDYPTVQFDKL